jgi:uncharacterized protein YndB with AHSA1/START domain
MIRWILIIVAVLVVLVLVLAIVGLLLPREHSASSRITLRQPPEAVWLVISDPEGVPSWWPEIARSERLPASENGRPRVRQTTKGGDAMILEVEQSEPPTRLRTLVVTGAGDPFGGTWTYQLAPTDSGTTLTITEDGWVSNPIFRVIMQAMGTHRTLDSYLSALGRRFGESTSPAHLD